MVALTCRIPLIGVHILTLGLSACGPQTSDSDGSDIRRDRPVTEAQAQSALSAFGLDEQGRASWG